MTEGGTVYFRFTASNAPSAHVEINLSATGGTSFLTATPVSSIGLGPGLTVAWLILGTENDNVDEPDATITATILTGTGYIVGSPSSATITVADNDGNTDSSLPSPPTGLSISIEAGDDNDLDVTYTRSESPHNYEFELRRSTTRNGSYSFAATANDSYSPANFDDQTKGYWYKARGRNCQTSSRTGCGDWSAWSNSIELPADSLDPPTSLSISIESGDDNDLDVTYTRSESPHYYEFELRRSTTRNGSYSLAATVNDSYSPANFDDQTKGYWYKARGRNCQTSSRTGCGDWSASNSIELPPDPPIPAAFQFTPGPLALGGTSNVWTIPIGVTSVYVDVSFSQGYVKNSDAGDININRVNSSGTVLSTLAVDNENDSGTLTGSAAGSLIRIDVDSDAFDDSLALVTLTFHSGSNATGLEIARATVQKESRPYAPTNGSSSVNETAGSVTLSWGPGAARLGSNPDHYEVLIPDAASPSTPLYSNLNVDDSTNPTTLTISNAMALGLEGSHTAEVRHCNAAGGCSSPLSVTFTLPPLPTIAISSQSPFTGQSVTMTASTPSTSGSVSSYRWQEFAAGQWTNLTSTVSSQSVTSSTSGERIFRVAITYASGVTKNSLSIRIEWRPIVVTVAASPANPESGDATKRMATLTATADAPPGVTYQWQQGNGSSWTNLGSPSTSATKTVSFTTRGTRKFRVVVGHTVVPSGTSAPIYVTWDEREIVEELITALRTAVTADATYTAAQTTLLTCMNGGSTSTSSSYLSFDDILSQYTGSTKTKMDQGGTCSTQATAMFNAFQTLSSSKLATLKTTNAVYAALLETPQGHDFEVAVGVPETVRRDASQLTNVFALDQITGAGGASGQSSTATHGFESCLPTSTNPSLTIKFRTLNCLQFQKSHSLWVTLHGDQAKQAALKQDLVRYAWLQYDDFSCSNRFITVFGKSLLDLPDPAGGLPCLKHDIPYASLQVLIADTGTPSETLDPAWNPRNKYLADHLFVIDGICGMRVGEQRRDCVPEAADNHGILDTLMHVSWWVPKLSHFGVSEINDKGWPITEQDAAHAKGNFEYLSCDVPKITNVNITYRSGRDFDATWTSVPGCVTDITMESYKFCLARTFSFFFFSHTAPMCRTVRVTDTPNTGSFKVPKGTSSVTLVSAALRPNDNTNEDLYYPMILFASQAPVHRE